MDAHLKQRHHRWYARLQVPRDVRDQFDGRHEWVQSLKTDSLKEARRLVGPIISDWLTRIEQARRQDPDAQHIANLQQSLKAAEDRADDTTRDALLFHAHDYAEELEKAHGHHTAREWHDRAKGKKTDLQAVAAEWLAAERYPYKSDTMHRQAIRLLAEHHPFIEDIDRPRAARFINETLLADRSPKTVQRLMSTYSQLWQWLNKRGRVAEPYLWRGLQPSTRKRRGKYQADEDQPRRPFTDNEARQLLAAVDAKAHKYPADCLVARVQAVTGMRLDEVCSIGSQHVTEPEPGTIWLHIQAGKNKNAIRHVPVTDPTVVGMIRERIEARRQDRDPALFPEYRPTDKGGHWSTSVSKRMGRRLREFTEAADLAPTHSWRHRAESVAERAALPRGAIDKFFGHSSPGEGLGRYYTAGDEERLKVARALTLPELLKGYH